MGGDGVGVNERDIRRRIDNALGDPVHDHQTGGAEDGPRYPAAEGRQAHRRVAVAAAEADIVRLVFSPGARDRGARCDQIPHNLPGVGFVEVDGQPEPPAANRTASPTFAGRRPGHSGRPAVLTGVVALGRHHAGLPAAVSPAARNATPDRSAWRPRADARGDEAGLVDPSPPGWASGHAAGSRDACWPPVRRPRRPSRCVELDEANGSSRKLKRHQGRRGTASLTCRRMASNQPSGVRTATHHAAGPAV